jgi:vacuolar-type H+-ATPase subunit I/STV1
MGELAQIIYGAAIIIISAFIAWEKIKENKLSKNHGLKPNPERCAIHETKIKQLEENMDSFRKENRQEHKQIYDCLDQIRERLARVEAKMNGGK